MQLVMNKFKIVTDHLSGEKRQGIPIRGNHVTENQRGMQRRECRECITWVSDALDIRTNQVRAELVRLASVSALLWKERCRVIHK